MLEEIGDLGDDGGVHAVQGAAQGGVLEDHGLQGHVAGPLADAEQGAVDGAGTVEPGGGGVGDGLVEVVVAVPLQALAGHVGVVLQAVDDTGHGPGHGGLGVGNTVAHGVAGADLDGDTGLLAQGLELIDEGDHEAVEIGPGDVLQMAAGDDTGIEGVLDDAQVVVQALLTGHVHLLEDVVVGAADQNAGLLDAKVLDQLEVLLGGSDPGGDLREFQIQLHALLDGLAVLLGVDEELGLADDAVGAAQLRKQLIDVDDLVNGVGLHGLLTVPQGGVGDPDLLGHGHGHAPVVEGHLGDGAVGVDVALQIGLRHVLEGIFIGFLFQQIGLGGNFEHGFRLLSKDVFMYECIQ